MHENLLYIFMSCAFPPCVQFLNNKKKNLKVLQRENVFIFPSVDICGLLCKKLLTFFFHLNYNKNRSKNVSVIQSWKCNAIRPLKLKETDKTCICY